ncbi:MAG: hypothetical protein WD208_03140 [Dehalococcoidia bacterium]
MVSNAAPSAVLNTYGELDELKKRCGITGTDADQTLWMSLYSASRAVEAHCNRRLYVSCMTRRFDVAHPAGFAVPDLVSVVEMREDANRDRVFEVIRNPDDYILHPLNADPETPWGRPYTRILADMMGPRPSFTAGRSAVEVEGHWGYRSDVSDTGAQLDVGGPLAVDSTSFTVTDGTKLGAGSTILVESEQMFVQQVSANSVKVLRGVNGTSAVSHVDEVSVRVFRYPPQVVESTLLLAARFWKRKDTPYGPAAGAHGFGSVVASRALEPDIEWMLSPFRRLPLGVAV